MRNLTKLKQKRLEKGLKGWEVAGKIGISQNYLYMWENGRAPVPKKHLRKLARLYECEVEELEENQEVNRIEKTGLGNYRNCVYWLQAYYVFQRSIKGGKA